MTIDSRAQVRIPALEICFPFSVDPTSTIPDVVPFCVVTAPSSLVGTGVDGTSFLVGTDVDGTSSNKIIWEQRV